jgi:phosphohistidine phosphatase
MRGRIQLFLVRHAIAEDRGADWPDDRLRPLTKEGAARMAREAAGLVALDVRIEEILTSPLVRARHTADILAAAWPKRLRVREVEALAPGAKPRAALQMLGELTKRTSVALVGHEPGLGELAGLLIGMRTPLTFKKGAVALVEVALLPPPAGSGVLQWLLTPRILRRLAPASR